MLNELINEVEERLRQIIREEIRNALLDEEIQNMFSADQIEKLKNKSVLSNEIPNNLNDKSNTKNEIPSLMTADDVAKMLNIDRQRVYEITRQRKVNGFPVIVLGERQYRYSREPILDWMKNQ